jgi:hypothetical protein
VNRLLRRIRRLKAYAAPLIAERNRREKYWKEKEAPRLAEDHLLRVILVFRYGEPRIDEPLALAYKRALLKWGVDEASSIKHLRGLLEKEPPASDIKSKISSWVEQMPDWLRRLCAADFSMRRLGLEPPKYKHAEDAFKLMPAESDWRAWPLLPKGVLEPCPEYGGVKMSPEEELSLARIWEKPENEWTRHERRFMREIFGG